MSIRYVCLSDTHFGDDSSILTCVSPGDQGINPLQTSPALVELINCIRHIIQQTGGGKPTLVLNGDILELALSETNKAAMVFERFIELTMIGADRMFKEIIYIPGNHDHHLWEIARETQYVEYIAQTPSGKPLDVPWHTTNIFKGFVPSYFLNGILKRYPGLEEINVKMAYPSFGVKDSTKCIVFSHGHFTEPLYHLVSSLEDILNEGKTKKRSMWDLEAENFAWIDFFWSTMCRSSGMDFESIYDALPYKDARDKIIEKISKGMAKNVFDSKYIPGTFVEEKSLQVVLKVVADWIVSRERLTKDSELSLDVKNGLIAFMQEPLRDQMMGELNQTMPLGMAFVFGHTHKPFENDMLFKGYEGKWVEVYNTGGWVVDKKTAQKMCGGSVVFVDEELNVAALRMYNETSDGRPSPVKAMNATHEGEAPNPLHGVLEAILTATPQPFDTFAAVVCREVALRQERLKSKFSKDELYKA